MHKIGHMCAHEPVGYTIRDMYENLQFSSDYVLTEV